MKQEEKKKYESELAGRREMQTDMQTGYGGGGGGGGGRGSDFYIKKNSQSRKHETIQYNTAKLGQPWPNVAAPMHRHTTHEQVGWLATNGI